MCGTMLEPARKATAPAPPAPVPVPTRTVENKPAVPVPTSPAAARPPGPPPSPPVIPPPAPRSEPVPPIGGPSLLGLDQPGVDVLRERAFTNLGSYGEEEPKSKGARLLLLVLLLAALGGGYWWTYTNYLKVADTHKPSPTASATRTGDNAASDAQSKSAPAEREDLPVRTASRAAAPVITPEPPAQKAGGARKAADTTVPVPVTSRHEVTATRPPVEAADDSGDALFRRGERYLYAKGGAEDCVNAMKYLKMASDKQNAKARSAMGTMYATGHCVSRDLPSAYRWFALALRVDPNNSVVEQNLSSVWNQMTPPERQLATKSQ